MQRLVHSTGRTDLPVRFRKVEDAPSAETVFAAIYAARVPVVWLDSSAAGNPMSRFSFMADVADPLSYALRYRSQSRELELLRGSGREVIRQSVFEFIKAVLSWEHALASNLRFQFCGGFVGYFGYELKGECDGRYVHASDLPDAYFLNVHRFLAFDHQTGDCFAVAVGNAGDEDAWLDQTASAVRDARDEEVEAVQPQPPGEDARFELEQTRDAYVKTVSRALEKIRAGESYQVCLTNRIRSAFTGNPFDLYRILRRRNPAPFCAFLHTNEFSVLETSPERFLSIDPGGIVETRPVKGTIRRSLDPAEDLRLADELSRSDKNRSEHLMIVDVLRNDVGRVARFGSVRVPVLMAVESYATVHHIVSTVRAELAQSRDVVDCIQAAFPGGSMTGAPKVRTMEILDDLESSARGVYSGALGYLSLGGAVDLSIVIRTIVVSGGSASIGAGGGVVVTSDPQDEFNEAMLKATALMDAIREYHGDSRAVEHLAVAR